MEIISDLHETDDIITCDVDDFSCDYCAETFQSRTSRMHHTATHFPNKICSTCNKTIICINGDWYELHTTLECDNQSDQSDVTVVEVEAEIIDYMLDDEIDPKSRAIDYGSDNSKDASIYTQSPIKYENYLKVEPLPAFVSKDIGLRTVYHKKQKNAPRKQIKSEKLVGYSNAMPRKKRKKVVNKATFLDHRPKAACICDICNKTLGTFSSLRNHIINMHCESEKNERVSCDECGQTFSTPGNLNSHKKIHMKCKAYVCTYCGRGFNQMHNLREHTNRHTGEKPYKCTYEHCGKSFGRKTNLTAHTRVHTGSKPFKCNIEGCDRAYMFEIDLKRHKYSIHGIFTKKHICPICSKVYPENKLLKKHLGSHSAGK